MPSKLKTNKYDYKCYYTDLATLLITQGTALHNCKTDEEVLDLIKAKEYETLLGEIS